MAFFDFESGISGWAAAGTSTISVETANPGSGAQSLRVEAVTTDWREASTPLTGLTPQTQYLVSYKAAFESSTSTEFYTYAQFGVPTSIGSFFSPADGSWITYRSSLWTEVADATLMIRGRGYYTNSATGDPFLIDDVEITPYVGEFEGFEDYALGSTPPHWSQNGTLTYTVSDDFAYAGTQSMKVDYSTNAGLFVTDLPLSYYPPTSPFPVWGRDVTISALVYVPSGQQDARLSLVFDTSNIPDNKYVMSTTTAGITDTWELLSITINSNTFATRGDSYSIVFSGDDSAAPSIFYVDNIEITFDDTALGTGACYSEDFEIYTVISEALFSRWSSNEDYAIVTDIDTTTVHSGTQSLKVDFPGLSTQETLATMKPYVTTTLRGSDYPVGTNDIEASVWVYVEAGSSPITVATADVNDIGQVIDKSTSTVFDEWQKLTVPLRLDDLSPTTARTYGQIFIYPEDNTTATTAYIDDVLMQPFVGSVTNVSSTIDAPITITSTAITIVPPTAAQLLGRELTTVNRALTPVSQPQFFGLCLNEDIALGDLVFNRIDEDGVLWVVTDIDGWWNLPDPEVKDYPRGMGDGSYDVQGRWLPRNLTLNGVILPPDPSFVPYARDNLFRATSLVHAGAWLRVDEQPTKVAYVRLSGRPSVQTVNARGRTEFSIGLRAADPIKYSWNSADPDGYASATIMCRDVGNGISGTGNITNAGNVAVKAIFSISGPIVGPATIQNLTTGELIFIIAPFDAGSFLEINTYDQVVALDGETYGVRSMLDVPTDWIRLTPGVNAFEFKDLGDVNSSAVMEVLYRSGWIG